MFTNNEIGAFKTTARNMAYSKFCDNKFVVCDPTNAAEIVDEAMAILLNRWKKLGRTADDLEDGYIYDLLSDAAEHMCFIPKNRGPLKPEQLVGMTHCIECGADFNWEDARWSVKNGVRQNKALCPVCGVFLVTCKIIVPVNLLSVSDNYDYDTYLTPTTPCFEQILCSRDSKHYQVADEFYKIDDNVITDSRIQKLLKPGNAPKWFAKYVEIVMADDELTQGQIAKKLKMTEAKLSSELQNFKGTAQVFCGGKRITYRKNQTKSKKAKQSGQLNLFD